jgi:HK97 family phage major capsid protein
MNLKALKEKRNDLLNQADEIVNGAEKEVRSLTPEEENKFTELENEIRDLDEQIKKLETRQFDGEKIEDKMEERDMDKKEKEIRGLEQFLRKQEGEEVRELQKTDIGGAVIPENVEGSIVNKMEETSPVFARARKFPSTSGALKIAKETAVDIAGFVGEGVNVAEGKLNLADVKLTQKRVGAAISLSNQFIHDSAVNIVDYSVGLLSRRAAKAVEKSILTGAGGDEFVGIKGAAGIAEVPVEGAVAIDHLLDLYNAIHPEFLDGSGFIMSRAFFNQVAKLKDGNNHFYMQNGVVNGKLTYTLFGAEVIVTDVLDKGEVAGDVPVIFGNIEAAYAVMIKKGFSLQHVSADTTQALRGSQLLVLDGYMDGTVYNEQALAKLVIAPATVV